jgi:hypothetical protein
MSLPTALVAVDEQLLWVVRVPESAAGTSRASTPEHIGEALAAFDALAAGLADDPHPGLTDLAALAASIALSALADLPDLPFIGEPFGGEDGTD